MAGTLLRKGDKPNIQICEFCVDTTDEIALLPTTTRAGTGAFKDLPDFNVPAPLGSTAIVGNGDADLEVYMLFTNGWKKL